MQSPYYRHTGIQGMNGSLQALTLVIMLFLSLFSSLSLLLRGSDFFHPCRYRLRSHIVISCWALIFCCLSDFIAILNHLNFCCICYRQSLLISKLSFTIFTLMLLCCIFPFILEISAPGPLRFLLQSGSLGLLYSSPSGASLPRHLH